VAPTLDSSALQPTAPSIGELPTTENGKTSWTRWAIPLTLVAIIGATVAYEQMRAPDARRIPAREAPRATEPAMVPSPVPEIIGTPLPNPMTTAAPAATSADTPAAPPPATAEPASASSVASTPAISAPAPAPITDARPSAPVAPPPASLPLVLTFRDFSWTEIKDRNGTVVLSRMNPGGTTQAIAAAPPVDIVIGNAVDVALTWKGQRIDLAPHTRQNVARLRLQ
jgi:cytoskeleton protein RodZ